LKAPAEVDKKRSPQIESKDLDFRALARVALMLNFKEQTK
jgi:hypothetical protein